jgi:hypothetical protein
MISKVTGGRSRVIDSHQFCCWQEARGYARFLPSRKPTGDFEPRSRRNLSLEAPGLERLDVRTLKASVESTMLASFHEWRR